MQQIAAVAKRRRAKRLIQEFRNCCFYNEEKQWRRRQDRAMARAMAMALGEKEEHYGRENVNYLGFRCSFPWRATNFYNLMQTNSSLHGTCDSSLQEKFLFYIFIKATSHCVDDHSPASSAPFRCLVGFELRSH
jgi:hypothetical protein